MPDPLRQYQPWELGEDGYPYAWHGKCICDEFGFDDGERCVVGACQIIPIKDMIREAAHHRCERCWHPYYKGESGGEWSLCDESCKHHGEIRILHQERKPGMPFRTDWLPREQMENFGAFAVEARYRILTVHHLDEDKANCRWWNLVALCQRCHLRMQRKVIMDRPYHYEHSEWFKPYAAAFYAFKYLDLDLDRATVMARQEELLKLEHRFYQDALL